MDLQQLIDSHHRIVFFGGAGVSTESGIPDFRSVDGLYHQKYAYPPEVILSDTFFYSKPEEFFKFYREKMIFPNARLAFATTTSVITERMAPGFRRENATIEAYNDIAREVMQREGVAVDDLYPVARDMPEDWHALDGTHFTEEGYRALAQAVASFLRVF